MDLNVLVYRAAIAYAHDELHLDWDQTIAYADDVLEGKRPTPSAVALAAAAAKPLS